MKTVVLKTDKEAPKLAVVRTYMMNNGWEFDSIIRNHASGESIGKKYKKGLRTIVLFNQDDGYCDPHIIYELASTEFRDSLDVYNSIMEYASAEKNKITNGAWVWIDAVGVVGRAWDDIPGYFYCTWHTGPFSRSGGRFEDTELTLLNMED